MPSRPPLKPVSEEFADLLMSCKNLEDLAMAESTIEAGMQRVACALFERTVQDHSERETSGEPGSFPPPGPA